MPYEENIKEFEISLKRSEKLILLSNFFKNKKLVLTALEQISYANRNLLIAILKFSHAKGEIVVSKDPRENKKILHEIVGPEWDIEKLLEKSKELSLLTKKHMKSPIEFMKEGKVVILDENQDIYTITIQKLREYLLNLKRLKKILKYRIDE